MKRRMLRAILALAAGTVFLFTVSAVGLAQDEEPAEPDEAAAVEETAMDDVTVLTLETVDASVQAVQFNVDMVWILVAGFLVFWMQAGFAFLESGMIRQSGVVNSLAENFFDATLCALVFFAIGFGVAYGTTSGGFFGTSLFFLDGADGTAGTAEEARLFLDAFYQFAFAAAAGTIITGAMAERTNFLGKIMYSTITAVLIYPIVVHWIWQGEGWLTDMGFLDFAGSTVVHQTGGVLALVGAVIVGRRAGVDVKNPPPPHNMALATLGTFILWFGWYGFNVGSTLDATNPTIMGLTAVNTTLAAAAGAVSAMGFMYFRTGKWDLGFMLNGSLAGLVGITASCAFVSPTSGVLIGLISGIIVVLAVDLVRAMGIDDAVGAFAVHGACGMFGTLSIGLFGLSGLTGNNAGLLVGGGVEMLGTQLVGVLAVTIWAAVTGFVMFSVIKALGILRIPAKAEEMGIDAYEHGASAWPDVLPLDEGKAKPAPAAGD